MTGFISGWPDHASGLPHRGAESYNTFWVFFLKRSTT
jgi:hypothetical protein